MMRRAVPLLPLALLAACASAPPDAGELARYTEEARRTSVTLAQQLIGELGKAMNEGGPPAAIGVCREKAPAIAGQLSARTGWKISRVSLKTRDPLLGTPDAWEQTVLMDLDARAAAGEKPDTLEHAAIVTEPAGRYFRYMKGLPVQPLCLNCHGSPQQIGEAVRARLAAEYPTDRATGYTVGQIRGAITIKRPL